MRAITNSKRARLKSFYLNVDFVDAAPAAAAHTHTHIPSF